VSNLKIGSRKRALEIWGRGLISNLSPCALPPQRSAFTENGDSSLFFIENRALSPFSVPVFQGSCPKFSVERSEEEQGRKMSSARRDHDFHRSYG